METLRIEVGENVQVRITTIGGDLRLTGREGAQLEAHAPVEGKLSVVKKNEHVEVNCRSGCLVFLPSDAVVEVDAIGGDFRTIGLNGDLTLGTVGGNCSLRRVGKVTIDRIGGDLDARKLSGDLSLTSAGGDGIVSKVEGSVKIVTLGGDITLQRVEGDVEVGVGGDASVRLAPKKDGHAVVSAGGDLTCRLPEDASAKITVQAGGDLRISGVQEVESKEKGREVRLGSGEAEIDLQAGGDLWLRTGSETYTDIDLGLGESITAGIEASMADMEARFDALGRDFSKFDSDRIGERVRRAVSRSMRKAEKARKLAERRAKQHHRERHISFGIGDYGGRDQVSEEERMSILRMLEQGKINIEEAESLLRALEG
ncbi:MAG TPA: DUF4097 domain-containing protein [Anaerolineae bacterium]|nr:DUF4097 domain-containing protein [Anaerolineae bacterium]